MALTVEELQIVLSCDATSAQKILDQMNATVKAYTERFQKYFNQLGSKRGPKNLVSDVKAIEKSISPVKKALGDIERNEYKVGRMLTTEEMSAQIVKNCSKATAETESYFQRSSAEYQKGINQIADNNQLIGLGAKMRGALEEATGGVQNMPEVLQYQVQQATESIRRLSAEYAKSIADKGEGSNGSLSIKKKLEAAIVSADKLYQKLMKIQEAEAGTSGAAAGAGGGDGSSPLPRIGSLFGSIRKKAQSAGSAIKKAFNHTLMGKFAHQLGRVMLRMAAMALIRGIINGAKQGLEQLAKTSASSAKAMNTIKAASGSIKMALGAALMPVIKALAPLFVKLAGVVSAAGNAIARFLAVVTGQSTYTAVNFSDSLDGISDSASGAGKAVKGMLADFDELIVIGNKGGGGGGGSTGIEQSLSTVSDLDAVSELGTKIREAIEAGDWQGVGAALAEKLNEVIASWNPEESAHSISEGIENALDLAIGFLETFDAQAFGEKIATFLEEVDWLGIGKKCLDLLIAGINAANGLIGGVTGKLLEDAFTPVADTAVDWGESIADFGEKFDKWYDELIDGVKERHGGKTFLQSVFEPVGDWFSGVGDSIAEFGTNFDQWYDDLCETISTGASNAWDSVKGWFSENVLSIDFDLQLPDLTEFSKVWEGLKGGTKTFTANLKGVKEKTIEKVHDAWEGIKTKTADLVTNVEDGIDTTISGISKAWGNLKEGKKTLEAKLSGVKDTVVAKLQENWNKLDDKRIELTSQIQSGIEGKVESIKKAWGDLKEGKKTLTATLAGTAESVFGKLKTAWTGIESKNPTLTAALEQKFAMVDLTTIKDAFNSIKEKVTSTFTAKMSVSTAVENFVKAWNGLKDVTVSLVAKLSDSFTSTWNSFARKWNNVAWLKAMITMPTFAQGGVVYGPTMGLIGEYSGARTNPEVIAPLSTLVDLLSKAGTAPGGSASQEQNDLLREQNRLLRQIAQKELTISPSVQLGQVISRSQKLYART